MPAVCERSKHGPSNWPQQRNLTQSIDPRIAPRPPKDRIQVDWVVWVLHTERRMVAGGLRTVPGGLAIWAQHSDRPSDSHKHKKEGNACLIVPTDEQVQKTDDCNEYAPPRVHKAILCVCDSGSRTGIRRGCRLVNDCSWQCLIRNVRLQRMRSKGVEGEGRGRAIITKKGAIPAVPVGPSLPRVRIH